MSSTVRRCVMALSLLLVVVASAASDIPPLTVEVNPTSLELPAAGSAQATLVVRNPTELTAKEVRVAHADLPGVMVEIEPADSQTIPSKSASAWTLRISQTGAGIVSGDVNLQVHYILVGEDGTEISDVVFTKITVNNRDQDDASQIVGVTVQSTLADLNDFRPGYIYLRVENKSDAPIEITDVIIPEWPAFIVLKPSADATPLPTQESRISDGEPTQIPGGESRILPYGEPMQIPGGESRILPVYVESGDQVRPGEHMLIFNVVFRRTVNGETQTGSVVAEHTVKVKVFGEEEVLGVMTSVTTFLFVPGFLGIIVAGMVWKVCVPAPKKDKFPFSLTATTVADPRFWVTMITLSLVMAWTGYPALSGILLPVGRREFLYGYGFQDIIWMWLFSVGLGAGFSLLAAAVVRIGQEIAARREEDEYQRLIKLYDEPMAVLGKIVDEGFDETRFREATVTASKGEGLKGFLIEPDRLRKTAFWIAPWIAIWWHEDATGLRDTFETLQDGEETRLPDLLAILQQEPAPDPEKRIAQVVWAEEEGYIGRPMRVDKSGLNFEEETKSIFLHKWEVEKV